MELDLLQKIFIWIRDRFVCDFIILHYKTILIIMLSCLVVGWIFDKFITNKIYHSLAYIGYFLFISYILFITAFGNSSLPKFLIFPEQLRAIWDNSANNIKYDSRVAPWIPYAKILDCKNIKQERDLCTTACAEIILKYYKDYNYDQRAIKALAENKKYNKNNFNLHYSTSFIKLVDGLSKIGYNWRVENVPNNKKYINKIQFEIDNNRPVIASTLWEIKYKPIFGVITHAVVIYGYDKDNFYILDPTRTENEYIRINKKLFQTIRMGYIILTSEKNESKN